MAQNVPRTFFLFLSLVFFVSISAYGREIYVDNLRGSDSYQGSSATARNENGPLRTIARALEIANSSDTIILTNNPSEPYREGVMLFGEKHSGTELRPFRIQGNGAVIDGSAQISPDAWQTLKHKGIFYYKPEHKAYQNLFFRGRPIKRLDTSNIQTLEQLVNLDWQPMRWCLFQGYVYFKPREAYMVRDDLKFLPYDGSAAAEKRRYALTAPQKQHGISLFHVHHVEISDLTLQGFQNDGIVASDAATFVLLQNVTCRGNARSGVTVGPASSLWIKDCVLGNNQFAQILTEEASQTSVFTSDLIPYPAPAWIQRGGVFYMDKKQLEGGLTKVEDFGNEDDPNYFELPGAAEETEVKEEVLVDEVEAGEEDGEEEASSPFGGDDDSEDGEEEDSNPFGGDDDSEDGEEEDSNPFGGDDDSEDGEEEDGDSEDGGFEDGDSEDEGGLFGGDDDSEDEDSEDGGSEDEESEDGEEDGGFSF